MIKDNVMLSLGGSVSSAESHDQEEETAVFNSYIFKGLLYLVI